MNATLTFPNPGLASTIVGNVTVGTGATVDGSFGAVTVDGNLVANQCLSVLLSFSDAVGGNVQIQYCTGESRINNGVDIGGNVACNNSNVCFLVFSNVKGNVEINDNSIAAVNNNTIGNNLDCQGNASITGGGNSVGGKEKGQCAGF